MTDRGPLGLPEFSSPQAKDAESRVVRRRLPVERGAQFLPPPSPETDPPPRPGRRVLDGRGLRFVEPSTPEA
jgi:hypothetical protein